MAKNSPPPIHFPLTLNAADDVVLNSDNKPEGISFSRIAMIAQAFMFKRANLRQEQKAFADDDRPEVTLFIDSEDIRRFETKPMHGRLFADIMSEICSSDNFEERQILAKPITSQIIPISKMLSVESNGRYKLGFRKHHLVVIDTKIPPALVKIGDTSYPLLVPYKTKGGIGFFRNEQVQKMAAAGLSGIPPDMLGLGHGSTRTRISRSNLFLRERGFMFLTVMYVGKRLYLLDLLQPQHWLKCCELRKPQPLLSKVTGFDKSPPAERWARTLYGDFAFVSQVKSRSRISGKVPQASLGVATAG